MFFGVETNSLHSCLTEPIIIIGKFNNKLIKTYDDLIKHGIPAKGYYNVGSEIEYDDDLEFCDENCMVSLSEKEAKSMRAMAMISQLMPYYGGTITDEECGNSCVKKYCIDRYYNKLIETINTSYIYHFLAFHTNEQRNEFLINNTQLIKEYLMIS